MKNDGTEAEAEFERIIETKFGKKAFLWRPADTKSVKGASKVGFTQGNPADYVLTLYGNMWYAEVKSCSDPVSFSFSQFTKAQHAGMVRQVAAGGFYEVYVFSTLRQRWYLIPASLILSQREAGIKSLKWDTLEEKGLTWTTK